jgi:murein DD-endopeptidase MepM/ murein hydrolase activator NlpD
MVPSAVLGLRERNLKSRFVDVAFVSGRLVGSFLTSPRRSLRKLAGFAALVVLLGSSSASAFDYARYQATDLDALMAEPRPRAGVDLYPARPLKLAVTLVSYPKACETRDLKKFMITAGIPKDQADTLQATQCIKVRSAGGKELLLFVQDKVADFLPKEVPLAGPVTLFAIHLFTAPGGPGLLVNEFKTDAGNGAAKSPSDQAANGTTPPCGCGSPDFHPGVDMTSETAGAPVQAVDDGVVVKVELDERATVDDPKIGRCGRYIVLKHSYPSGLVVFTRYAQLDRVVDANGRPIAAGARIKKSDKIGEVGSSKILHFEVRPADPKTMETGAAWTARYGADTAMEWSRYQPVDPRAFDPDSYGKTSGSAK